MNVYIYIERFYGTNSGGGGGGTNSDNSSNAVPTKRVILSLKKNNRNTYQSLALMSECVCERSVCESPKPKPKRE